jgi:hypothetical protein
MPWPQHTTRGSLTHSQGRPNARHVWVIQPIYWGLVSCVVWVWGTHKASEWPAMGVSLR